MLAVGVVGLVIVGRKLSVMVVVGNLLLELLVVVPTVIWSFVWSVSEFWSGLLVDIVRELLAVVWIGLALVAYSVVNIGEFSLAK
jgi:hypothetical protein